MTGEEESLFHLENVKKVCFPNLVYISSRKFRVSNVCHEVRTFPRPIYNIKLGKANRGFPGGTSGKESACQCRRHKRQVQVLGLAGPLEKGMATHSSILS